MSKRKIIEIDREKCNGCGLCTKACAEGALALDEENKAYLVKEIFCDGLGACLDVCPADALHIVEKDALEYSPKAAYDHVLKTSGKEAASKVHGAEKFEKTLPCGCPGMMAKEIKKTKIESDVTASGELSQWPIQLRLVSPFAPYFNNSDLLIASDCTAFALGSFHKDLLKGKKIVIACPKLDDTGGYIEKISDILANNTVYSLTVAIMSLPCCSSLYHIAAQAVELSKKNIAVKKIIITPEGTIA